MDLRGFINSYQNVVFHLREKHPAMAEHLYEILPQQLKTGRVKWVVREPGQRAPRPLTQKIPNLPMDQFLNSLHQVALLFTYGMDKVPPNPYRANKFIRIMKIMGDERYIPLRNHWNEERRRLRGNKI